MKIAFFSTKSYDREFFERFNTSGNNQLTFFEAPLNIDTVNLTAGYRAVCVFVNDKIDGAVAEKLAANGVGLVALRCAGITSHQGFFTKEALEQIAAITFKNISDFENGIQSSNEVTV